MDAAQTSLETLAVSWVTVQIINWLKRSAWAGWVTQEAKTVSRMIAAVITFIGTFGVVVVCNGDAASGWNCTLSIPPTVQLQTFVIRWLGTLSVSHMQYEIGQSGKRATAIPPTGVS